MSSLKISHPTSVIKAKIHLPASKSECNRALIINALTDFKCDIQNISTARDSVTMNRLLRSDDAILDVIDAGTTMRFLTSYLSLKGKEKTLTGTARMCERPIKLLVDALRSIGAEIDYLKEDGFPPIKINGIRQQTSNKISIRGDVSSQYISSLLMIAPILPKGLILELTGEIGSRPYIMMTLQMMADFGINYTFEGNIISVNHQPYKPSHFFIESDWSGASYWYSVVALAKEAEIELVGLKKNSLQGDSAIVKLMENLGVSTQYKENSIVLRKTKNQDMEIAIDFTDCPDIAQTLAVICGANHAKLTLTGVESLKIKETDRLLALQNELAKIGISLAETIKNEAYQVSGIHNLQTQPSFATYKDHRMAMAFAPLALKHTVLIENPDVVVKSYPSFWDDLKLAGFEIEEV
ncbi:MAG: 3-phosphoshikimate 1-carboxyvinyltransferase [Bacteroidetes bacterium]|nr:MAG: 3-phosphoshikimate 1-carboxyvinyltransferase [Bacteroidota bacterium]